MNLGKNIIYYRKKLQITQEDLAERLYVSRQTISRWENESVIPDVETIIKLCEIFGCDMDTLVRGNGEEIVDTTEKIENEQRGQREVTIQIRHKKRYRINNVICSVTMLVATFVFFMLGSFFEGGWSYAWMSYVIGAFVCAISSVITYS